MNRQKYIITRPDKTELAVWGNGYEVNQAGVLSVGQMRQFNGQMVPMLVLSMADGQWLTIHEMEDGDTRPSYMAQGTVMTQPKPVVIQ